MPCYQQNQAPANLVNSGVGSFATEAECLEACKEGACCNGTTCSVKPQCQCNAAAGEVFKGVGTVCSPNPCACGCTSSELDSLKQKQIFVQLAGFMLNGRTGFDIWNGCSTRWYSYDIPKQYDCSDQYGYLASLAGFPRQNGESDDMWNSRSSIEQSWIAFFNSISATLTFNDLLSSDIGFVWTGQHTGTSPFGQQVTHAITAGMPCGGGRLVVDCKLKTEQVGDDSSCPSAALFRVTNPCVTGDGPIPAVAFAMDEIYFASRGCILEAEQPAYYDNASATVYCSLASISGCRGFGNEGNAYRARFAGQVIAQISSNPLP